jgi:NADPH:quinone reductase-like Zn-dependent oxidoreductase
VEGLRQTLWKGLSSPDLAACMEEFYDKVYDSIDVSALLAATPTLDPSESSSGSTGYSLAASHEHLLRRILMHTPRNEKVSLASNSPLHHVKKVVHAMGLTRVPWTDVWTPDRNSLDQPSEVSHFNLKERNRRVYPTKMDPAVFFDSLFTDENDHMSDHEYRLVLVDDSPIALYAISTLSENSGQGSSHGHWSGVQVTPERPVQQALGLANKWIRDDDDYRFSQVDYLRSKNVVDYKSMNRETWRQMSDELVQLMARNREESLGQVEKTLTIVDVGAGILSMLRLVVEGYGRELPSLLRLVQEQEELTFVEFYAYESNQDLREACQEELERLGFVLQEVFHWDSSSESDNESFDPELVFIKEPGNDLPLIVVHLRMFDFDHHTKRPQPTPHLIIGSAFADLMEPYELTKSLMRRFLSSSPSDAHGETLVYFPITFRGTTQFLPACPVEQLDAASPIIPSDTIAFKLYAKSLTELHGHSLDPLKLEEAMGDFGAVFLSSGRSDWIIDPDDHGYLWETMLYFFGTLAAPQLRVAGWNDQEWLARARFHRPTIAASNVDLLFRLPHLGHWEVKESIQGDFGLPASFEEIQFTAPYQVGSIPKQFIRLGPNEVRVRSVCSLISSGTELKIFKGIFDDAPLDVNIKGMEEERMAYPLTYGYSLVGRVVECGANVEDADSLLGKLVFAFSPHASQVVTDRAGIHIVPEGIDALDAIFMPSVETAVSLVHDAHPRMGEQVGVFGQGVIGLLVTTLLGRLGINQDTVASTFGLVTTFDALPERLAVSSAMGSSQALLPSEVDAAGPFDVSIEVSGNGKALQAAIDSTRDGGRVVIGSWYGNTGVHLDLGINFHRSHKKLIASQVSEIAAELTATWSKERRFAYTWDLVRQIRPSRLITKKTTIDKAQDAYISLENGGEIAVVFEY